MSLELALEHGLKEEEYKNILDILGREPNLVELGLFSVMWSEHCSYKSTRAHLSKLPTKAEWVICGPGENAGIIDIGDNQAAIFKMESHNHPSFIEPYQGAATGVGGILRDVFTMGARPIANLNSLRFGEATHPKTKFLLSGVVAGIGGYGNAVGVPTVAGECTFHESYNGNILVNAMNVGLADQDKIFYSAASSIGSPVVYVGSKTGRDGIHGATMASAEFDEESEDKRPTVQVGDPFAEKLLIEACQELMLTDAILSIQDMGAAGLTSSSLEMAGKGGTGIELELSLVPTREEGMTPYEIMLSESQERMLMVLKPGKEDIAEKIFRKWGLDFAIIGKITNTGNVVLKMRGEEVANMPIAPLSDKAPKYERPYKIIKRDQDVSVDTSDIDVISMLKKLIASPDLCSKRWIYEQYDYMVMNDTIAGPGSDAALVRVHGTEKALAMSSDCTPRYCSADPVMGAMQAVAETYRNISASGATPMAITNCLNFGNPEKPEIMGQIVGAIEGISAACLGLNYPVISGNVSLYNETNGNAVYPTPSIGGVGLIKDMHKSSYNFFDKEGLNIFVIGETKGHIGSSLLVREILGKDAGLCPNVDIALEKKNADFVREQILSETIKIAHDISDGGLLIALTEMCMVKNIGAKINIDTGSLDLARYCFAEDQARFLVAVTDKNLVKFTEGSKKFNIKTSLIGKTSGKDLVLNDTLKVSVSELKKLNEEFLPNLMAK